MMMISLLQFNDQPKKGHESQISFKLRSADRKRYPTNSEKEMLDSELVADSIIIHDPYYQKYSYTR
ncbi:hypothetical protein ASG33_23210 [Dyadobacter sp. Leaf189]|nr:hypothetical protein ASG33_23210 [Dyadobacter sp. Leaf189]